MEILEVYKIGHIESFWDEQYKLLNYKRYPFNNENDIDTWRKEGFTQKNFTGELFSLYEPEMIKWADPFFTIFQGKKTSINFYKMSTGDILPYHSDSYIKFKMINNLEPTTDIYRSLIFLEDRKEGHIFEIDGKLLDWRAGDYVLWKNDIRHMAANIGSQSRYTVQITFIK